MSIQKQKKQNTVSCKSCGASFSADLPNCPYCGTMNLSGAEKDYMTRLEGVRSGLEGLAQKPKQEIKSSFRAVRRRVLAAAVVLLLIVAGFAVKQQRDARIDAEKDLAEAVWQLEYFPKLDAAYNAGDYALLDELYDAAQDEDHRVWNYKHYHFCEFYQLISRAEEALQHVRSLPAQPVGEDPTGDEAWFLYCGLELLDLENRSSWMPEEDYALLESLRAPLLEELTARYALTEEDLASFRAAIKKDGFVSFDTCETFMKERGLAP